MGNVGIQVFGDMLSFLFHLNVGQDNKLDINRAKF